MRNFVKDFIIGREAKRLCEQYRIVSDDAFEYLDSRVMITPKETLWERPEYKAMMEEERVLEQRHRNLTGKRIWVSDEEWQLMEEDGTKKYIMAMYGTGLGDLVEGSSINIPLMDLVCSKQAKEIRKEYNK